MSLVAMRLSLIHLATTQRETLATDGWNDSTHTGWSDHLTSLPCRLYSRSGNELVDKDTVVVVENLRMIVPAGSDVTEQDRVTAVTYRGASILTAPAQIRAVTHRKDHLELALVRIA